jgi:hypothetical protein
MSNDLVKKRRMDAYYYGFDETGVDVIDKVLSAVACAGKAYHHTDDWTEDCSAYEDHTGDNPVAWIQNASKEAADRIEALEAALQSIAANACCDKCQEAAFVACAALEEKKDD